MSFFYIPIICFKTIYCFISRNTYSFFTCKHFSCCICFCCCKIKVLIVCLCIYFIYSILYICCSKGRIICITYTLMADITLAAYTPIKLPNITSFYYYSYKYFIIFSLDFLIFSPLITSPTTFILYLYCSSIPPPTCQCFLVNIHRFGGKLFI